MGKSLSEFSEERQSAIFEENARIARTNRTLRSALSAKEKELEETRARLARYEHPSSHIVEKMLKTRNSVSRDEIVKELGCNSRQAEKILQDMASRGYSVRRGVLSKAAARKVTVEHFYGPEVRFGVVSDTHLGNEHAMVDQLHEAYAVFEREGIERVYCPGNLLDGEKTYRGQEYEINVMGAENVVANLAHLWPRSSKITTYHVASSTCHEGYYLRSAGILIGKLIERERPDMVYLGLDEADIVMQDTEARPTLRIIHPGGGSSYAHSYRPQKIVESYSGAEKPAILIIGHYHKSGFYDIRNVAVFQAGCLERQTPFMRKRALEAHMGFWIIELKFTEEGSLRRIKQEWFKYYVGTDGKILRSWRV